jgi:arylsulfatase A-like enzyme/Flp pilus assembly protein TadD
VARGGIRILLLAVAASAAASSAYLGTRPSAVLAADRKLHVIFITIDTLRADRLGCYGYGQIQTPNIDALAASGVRFTHAYSPVPITLPAHTAIFTGSSPMATGVHDYLGNNVPPSAVTLAETLRQAGYSTGAFLGAAVLDSRFGLNQGFDTYFDHFDFKRVDQTNIDRLERRGDLVVDEALGWLQRNPRRPFFLWVHLYDPHYPYLPPEPYAGQYRDRPYDGEIAFADAQVGRLLSALREVPGYENSLVVLASDHGESLGEHGEKKHGFFVYNSTIHVPLLIKVPGVPPRVVEENVSLIDVMPTVLQALGLPAPAAMQGRSLLSALQGRPSARASEVYAESYLPLLHFRWSPLRALHWRHLKYIDAPRPELYDTREDPQETRNLFAERQSTAHEIRSRLLNHIRRFTPASASSASEEQIADPALRERLQSLGYLAISAGTYAEAGDKSLADPKDRIRVYELFWDAMDDERQGRYRDSLRKLQEAELREPNSLPFRYLTGLNHFRLRNYARAVEALRAASELNPQFPLAPYYLGVAYTQLSDFEAAFASFKKALELNAADFSAAFGLGAAYLKAQQVDEAAAAFEQAVRINPEFAEAYTALGEIYLHKHQIEDAIRVLEKAVQLAPGSPIAHRRLGQAYEAKGLHAQAQEEFRRANPSKSLQ